MKKIISVILAALMLLTVIPFAGFAGDAEAGSAGQKVEAWEANFGLLLEKTLSNEDSTHWVYVAQNNEQIAKEMLTYTAFALYDNAWKNGFDGSVSVTRAEEILVSLIEKVDAEVEDSKLEEVIAVLSTASDVNDFIQKVNGILNASDVVASQEWSDAFTYLNYAITLGNIWLEQRDILIEAYARVLTVKAANDNYIALLEYVADNSTYDVVVQAAQNLIDDINTSIDEIISEIMLDAAEGTAAEVLTVAARIAAETNVYTAVALKIYNIGTSVADKLWNTSDQYEIMDQLFTVFYVETAVAEWTDGLFASRATEADAEKAVFATSALLSLRDIGTQSLYDLKLAQADGFIGRIKNKINRVITEQYTAELQMNELIRTLLFKTEVDSYKPVTACFSVYCPVNVSYTRDNGASYITLFDGKEETLYNSYGAFSSAYNEYSEDYQKAAIIYGNEYFAIEAVADGKVTCIVDVMQDGLLCDYSFTDKSVIAGDILSIPCVFTGTPYCSVVTATYIYAFALNDEYVYPEENAATIDNVSQATGEVVYEEVLSFFTRVKNLFTFIFTFQWIKDMFN